MSSLTSCDLECLTVLQLFSVFSTGHQYHKKTVSAFPSEILITDKTTPLNAHAFNFLWYFVVPSVLRYSCSAPERRLTWWTMLSVFSSSRLNNPHRFHLATSKLLYLHLEKRLAKSTSLIIALEESGKLAMNNKVFVSWENISSPLWFQR